MMKYFIQGYPSSLEHLLCFVSHYFSRGCVTALMMNILIMPHNNYIEGAPIRNVAAQNTIVPSRGVGPYNA